MRVPPVSDRIKEAPAQALRGVFAGIGQLLLITDKLRNKTPADQHVPAARVPEPTESVAEADGATVVQEQAAAAGATAGVAEAAEVEAPAEVEVTVEAEVTEVPRVRKPAEPKPARPKATPSKATQSKATPSKATPSKATQEKAAQAKAAAPKAAEPKAAEPKAAEPKAAPRPPAQRTPKTPAEKATETRDFDRTGNVRLLPDTGSAARAASARADAKVPAEQAASEPPPAVGEPPAAAHAEEAAGATAATGTTAEAGAAEAPLPNYGELSVASLRARLRNLDIGQVRELAEYEKAHAGRADVIAMFERRIAKLEAGE
jgi:hypothetical protein